MTRAKTKPPMRKPLFDEESILRFAAPEEHQVGGEGRHAVAAPDRLSLTLTLKSEIIGRLNAEAARKGKPVDQIVEKLVTKHLGKH